MYSYYSVIEEFHKECSSSCVSNGPAQLNDFYNALAIPLLNGWTRCVCVCVVCVHAYVCKV